MVTQITCHNGHQSPEELFGCHFAKCIYFHMFISTKYRFCISKITPEAYQQRGLLWNQQSGWIDFYWGSDEISVRIALTFPLAFYDRLVIALWQEGPAPQWFLTTSCHHTTPPHHVTAWRRVTQLRLFTVGHLSQWSLCLSKNQTMYSSQTENIYLTLHWVQFSFSTILTSNIYIVLALTFWQIQYTILEVRKYD